MQSICGRNLKRVVTLCAMNHREVFVDLREVFMNLREAIVNLRKLFAKLRKFFLQATVSVDANINSMTI